MTRLPSRSVEPCGGKMTEAPIQRVSVGKLSVELENGQLRCMRFGSVEAPSRSLRREEN
jgi:hypothetical protein